MPWFAVRLGDEDDCKPTIIENGSAYLAGVSVFGEVSVRAGDVEYKICDLISSDDAACLLRIQQLASIPDGWRTIGVNERRVAARASSGTTRRSAKPMVSILPKAPPDAVPVVKFDAAVRLIASGMKSSDIAEALGLTRQQVAGVKAHVTMGTYNETPEERKRKVEEHFAKLGL